MAMFGGSNPINADLVSVLDISRTYEYASPNGLRGATRFIDGGICGNCYMDGSVGLPDFNAKQNDGDAAGLA